MNIKRFLTVLRARNRELLRDKTTWVWNLVFPICLVFAVSILVDDREGDQYRVGVTGAADTQFETFLATPHIQFIVYADATEARDKLAKHQIDLVIDGAGDGRYWVNSLSPRSLLVEKILHSEVTYSRYHREVIQRRGLRYLDWVLPGILGVNIMHASLFGIGLLIVRYRKQGVLKRLQITPLTAFEFLSAQIVSRLLLLVCVTPLIYGVMNVFFGFYRVGSYALLILLLAAGSLALISLGVLAVSRGDSEEAATGWLNLITWPMVLLSGVWFSLEGTHWIVQKAALLLPLTHLLSAVRAVMFEGAGLAIVWPRLLILCAMSAIFLGLAAYRFRWRENVDLMSLSDSRAGDPKQLMLRLSNGFAGLPDKVLTRKWTILIVVSALSLLMLLGGITRLSVNTVANSFIGEDDPAIRALNQFRYQFGSDDAVYLVYRARDNNVFSRESLAAVQALTRDLENWQTLSLETARPSQGAAAESSELRHIRRVLSLGNIRYQSARGDTLRSDRLVPEVLPREATELAAIRATAMAEASLKRVFFSADGRYGAVLIQTDFGALLPDDYVHPVNDSGVTLDESFSSGDGLIFDPSVSVSESANASGRERANEKTLRYEKPDNSIYANFFSDLKPVFSPYEQQFEFYPVGYSPLMEFVQKVLRQTAVLNLALAAIMVFLLWILFRSLSAVVWPALVVLLSIVWVSGIAAWSNTQVSTMINLTMMLILTVGIADCVHVLSAYFNLRRAGTEHRPALSRAYAKTGLAMLLTTLTTILGMAALLVSELVPIRVFALTSALGVGLALVFTLVLLPVLLDIWHPVHRQRRGVGNFLARRSIVDVWVGIRPRAQWALLIGLGIACSALWGASIGAFATLVVVCGYSVARWHSAILTTALKWAQTSPRWIVVIAGSVLLLSAYGTSLLRVDSNVTELIKEDSVVRRAYDVVDTHMAGVQNMEIMIDTGKSDGVADPALLAAIESLQKLVSDQYSEHISRSFSIADIVKDINRILHQDDDAWYKIPESRQLIAQLLYLFGSANPEDRRSIISDDFSQTHITLNLYNTGSEQYQLFFNDFQRQVDQLFTSLRPDYPRLEVTVTGSVPLIMRTADLIAKTQYRSFLLVLVMVSVVMIFASASPRAGFLAMIPNLLPALLVFGAMGLFDIALDTDTLLIAPIIIGIVVDDTLHFTTRYRLALLQTRDSMTALKNTVMEVGQAVMFTSMVLGLGFAILSFSDYLGTAKMGFFGALAIFAALLCDLLLLPALILIFKLRFGIRDVDVKSTGPGTASATQIELPQDPAIPENIITDRERRHELENTVS